MTHGAVAIIGAGMAGLACGTQLSRNGVAVTLFDKGRGPGGRMATRRVDQGGATLHFDHGAQYFTARDAEFAAQVRQWEAAGHVAPWPEAGDAAYVGTPGMNAPLKAMAQALDVRWGARVDAVSRMDEAGSPGWELIIDGTAHRFASVICAVPAEQAAHLLAHAKPDFAALANASSSQPCWAVMASFAERLPLPDHLRNRDGAIAWAARNASKPGRGEGETWVLHASPGFTRGILEFPPEDAAQTILRYFFEQAGIDPQKPDYLTAHRWLYAMAQPSGHGPMKLDSDAQIGLCGDWLVEPRVEGAWLSGHALAKAMIALLVADKPPV